MRLVHTSDIHLDASFASSGMSPEVGKERRGILREVFEGILRRASEWPADAVLIAGDLFEEERVGRDTVSFLAEAFEAIAPIPVFISPGNCDPCAAASPYLSEAWPANVHIFREPQWTAIRLDGLPLTVYGFGFDEADPGRNPFGALQVPRDGRVHVGVAHGSEMAHLPPGKAVRAAFDAGKAIPPGLHYLALGHYHETMAVGEEGTARAYYSGSPEPLGFKDAGPHHFLEVETGGEDGSLEVRPVSSAKTAYNVQRIACADYTRPEELAATVLGALEGEGLAQAVRVLLSGPCAQGLHRDLPHLAQLLQREAFFLDIVDESFLAEDFDSLADEPSAAGLFLARMNGQLRDAPDDRLRRMLARARDAGLCAFRELDLPLRHGEDSAT